MQRGLPEAKNMAWVSVNVARTRNVIQFMKLPQRKLLRERKRSQLSAQIWRKFNFQINCNVPEGLFHFPSPALASELAHAPDASPFFCSCSTFPNESVKKYVGWRFAKIFNALHLHLVIAWLIVIVSVRQLEKCPACWRRCWFRATVSALHKNDMAKNFKGKSFADWQALLLLLAD